MMALQGQLDGEIEMVGEERLHVVDHLGRYALNALVVSL